MAQSGVDLEVLRTLYERERLGVREVAIQLGVSPWRVYGLMRRHGIPRRRGSEQNYATYKAKPQFALKQALSDTEVRLRIAGSLLYLAEGVKSGGTVDFVNSDPRLVRVFLAFLREVCGVAEPRLRVLLYAYADQDLVQLKRFWADVTKISEEQFVRPYVRPLRSGGNGRKMAHGLIHVRYNDTRLLKIILQWGSEVCESWAGARVANWSSL